MKLFLFLVLGLVLGASGFGLQLPSFAPTLQQIAACGFLFVAGLELSFKKVSVQMKPALILSAGSFLLPFVMGLCLAGFVLPENTFKSALFFAIALSVSALPVIIQYLQEIKLYNTPVGSLIVASATICDIIVWVAFTFLLETKTQEAWLNSHVPVFCFFIGLAIADLRQITDKMRHGIFAISKYVFAPIFFIGIGWKIKMTEHFHWQQALTILVIATVGKFVGSYVASGFLKMDRPSRILVSFSLNARGAMEILLASTALQQGLIDETLFTSLIALALITSLILGPLTSTTAARSRQ
ncbi:cation:proton antiporter [Bdellovibrio sp. HCB2-146]|uniref:cation:proton antiporter n=1 Tax=Bdellovibrio sp. HCB2-146 TaxID=3394362 RepID=UPI0039BD67CD